MQASSRRFLPGNKEELFEGLMGEGVKRGDDDREDEDGEILAGKEKSDFGSTIAPPDDINCDWAVSSEIALRQYCVGVFRFSLP